MKRLIILAAVIAATPAAANELPFWKWFSQPVTVHTDEKETHIITPDGRAEAKASHTGQGTNSVSASSSPTSATARATSSSSASGSSVSVSSSSTSTASAGSMQ